MADEPTREQLKKLIEEALTKVILGEDYEDRRKLLFEFFKHLTTLSLAALAILSGLYGWLFDVTPKSFGNDALVFGSLIVSIILSLRAMVVVAKVNKLEFKQFIDHSWSPSMKLATFGFVAATVFTALDVWATITLNIEKHGKMIPDKPAAVATDSKP